METELYFPKIDKLTLHLFTNGNCHSLAFALNHLIGGIIVLGVYDNYDHKGDWFTAPNHAGLLYNGSIIDINGQSSKKDWSKRWGRIVEVDKEIFNRYYLSWFYFPPEIEPTIGIAKRVLKVYEIEI